MNLKTPNVVYDISEWEYPVKIEKMTAPRPWAVIARASMQAVATRIRTVDKNFLEYIAQVRAMDIYDGMFHFLTPNGIAEQAALFLTQWEKVKGTRLAPIVDVEVDLQTAYKGAIGNAVWQGHVKTFLDLLSAGTGMTPMIYTNETFWSFVCTRNALKQLVPPAWTGDYPVWVAQYPDNPDLSTGPKKLPSGWKQWAMWQYSEKGRQNGFLANDLNIAAQWFVDEVEGNAPTPEPEPVPTPEPTPTPTINWPDKVTVVEGTETKDYFPQ